MYDFFMFCDKFGRRECREKMRLGLGNESF